MLTNIDNIEKSTSVPDERKEWIVIYTKSRREKKIAHYCTIEKIKYYLPLEQRMKLYGRKKVQTTLPLFPGYLFCIVNKKEQYKLLLTHQVAKILNVSNQFNLVEDLEKLFVAESCNLNLIPWGLSVEGKKARIEVGPMRGVEGIISRIKGEYRIILNVNFIKRAAAVEIDRSYISLLN